VQERHKKERVCERKRADEKREIKGGRDRYAHAHAFIHEQKMRA